MDRIKDVKVIVVSTFVGNHVCSVYRSNMTTMRYCCNVYKYCKNSFLLEDFSIFNTK